MSLHNKSCKIGNGDMRVRKTRKALYFNILRMNNSFAKEIYKAKNFAILL